MVAKNWNFTGYSESFVWSVGPGSWPLGPRPGASLGHTLAVCSVAPDRALGFGLGPCLCPGLGLALALAMPPCSNLPTLALPDLGPAHGSGARPGLGLGLLLAVAEPWSGP